MCEQSGHSLMNWNNHGAHNSVVNNIQLKRVCDRVLMGARCHGYSHGKQCVPLVHHLSFVTCFCFLPWQAVCLSTSQSVYWSNPLSTRLSRFRKSFQTYLDAKWFRIYIYIYIYNFNTRMLIVLEIGSEFDLVQARSLVNLYLSFLLEMTFIF